MKLRSPPNENGQYPLPKQIMFLLYLRVPIVTLMITSDKLLRNSIENIQFFIIPYGISSHSSVRFLVVMLMIISDNFFKIQQGMLIFPRSLYSLI